MKSHLEDGSGGRRPPNRTVFTGDQVDQMAGGGQGAIARTVHGDVVEARDIYDHVGGSLGNLEGAPTDARARMYTEAGLPYEARDWRGSATIYTNRELPYNDFQGMGFHGSEQIVTARDLDAMDAQFGTGHRTEPEKPGAYLLQDGNVLLIANDGRKAVITQAQYQQLQAQHQQQQRIAQQQSGTGNGLVGRLLSAAKRQRPNG